MKSPNSINGDLKSMFLNGAKLAIQFYSSSAYTATKQDKTKWALPIGQCLKGKFPEICMVEENVFQYFSDLNHLMLLVQKFKYGKLCPLIYVRIYQQK